jgi:opacity protein-like surface antigen
MRTIQLFAALALTAASASAFARADCYLGLVGGLALGSSQHQDAVASGDLTGSFSVNGGTGGALAGCRWPLGPSGMLGFEADYSTANVKGSVAETAPNQAFQAETRADRISTFRVVAGGNLTQNWAIYGSAGLAAVPTKASVCNAVAGCATDNQTLVGFAGGFSSEYAFTPSIRMRLEYLYVGLETKQFAPGPFLLRNVDLDMSLLRAGVSFHF